MKHYKITAPVALRRNQAGWEEEPIAAGVSAQSKGDAIKSYKKRVQSLYVDNGKFSAVDFYGNRSKYTVEKLDEPLSW